MVLVTAFGMAKFQTARAKGVVTFSRLLETCAAASSSWRRAKGASCIGIHAHFQARTPPMATTNTMQPWPRASRRSGANDIMPLVHTNEQE